MEERAAIDLRAGDTVRVTQKIKEGEKTRMQAFEGLVLARKHGTEAGATFTVRKVIDSVGVERIFPLYSPVIDKIEVLKRSKVRQSKLYHIREKAAKAIRREIRNIRSVKEKEEVKEEVTVTSEDIKEAPTPSISE
ncbi:MAG: 50S ribosomal protein L19 [Parcubacteria group bacterium CG11_big_fil_rev_8_21_14_0_20_39_22]|nr:MAG: 50S ribosomal protein L19 [Parcubacteria group bacterium CG11_big_fil_rev_8_21_14_0_20_39_22]